MTAGRFVRESLGFAASQYLARVAMLGRGLAAAAALGPAGFGGWNALNLIFDYGSVSPTFASLAARVQEQTGIPYLLIDGRLERTPASLRRLGDALGVADRAAAIARYVADTERMIDDRLEDVPMASRRRVYLAREPNGLETGLTGSINTEIIERAGGVNVAERGNARGGIANVSIEQVLAWAPDTIITWDAHFYAAYADDPVWAAVPAVKDRRVFLAPRLHSLGGLRGRRRESGVAQLLRLQHQGDDHRVGGGIGVDGARAREQACNG